MKKSVLSLGGVGLMVVLAGAQETNTVSQADKEFSGGEIIVTAERIRPVETASTTRVLTAEDLERRGVNNVTEAMRSMPGVYTRTANDGTERIDIRGFRTRHVNLLLNGVPMNNTYDGQFDAALIPVENISKIKVGYGNQSVLYGSGGLGGVINVITKSGEQGSNGTLEVQTGEGERYLVRGALSQSSEKVSVFVGASHAEQDHFKLSDDFEPAGDQQDDERINSDYIRNNLLGSVSVDLGNDWTLGSVVNLLQGEYGKPPNVDKPKYERVDDYKGGGGQVTLNRTVEAGVDVRAALYYDALKKEEARYDDVTYSSITANKSYLQDSTSRAYGANLQVGRDFWKGFDATAAASVKVEEYEADGTYGNGNPIAMDEDLLGGMVGVEANQRLFENWVILGGVSQNWQQDDDGTDADPGYMIATTYDVFDATTLHASYAHQIRFPSIKQLYDADGGNPDLTTESSDNYEAGIIQGVGDRTMVDVTGFLRDVDDFIEKDINDINQNFESYTFVGVETTVETELTDSLNGYFGYTYLQTENNDTKKELQYRPNHVTQLGAEWTLLKHLILFGNVRYVAGQYADATETNEADDYVVVNLRATLAFWDAMDLYVGVDNVFDENYAQSVGVPREGRTFYVGAKATF